MRISALMILVLAVSFSLPACRLGCGEARVPSWIAVELADPLPEGSYEVLVCVDDRCDRFSSIEAPGTGSTEGADIEIQPDLIQVTPWAQRIEPGEHQVEIVVSTDTSKVLSFEGLVEFQSNGRCYADDSNVTIKSESVSR